MPVVYSSVDVVSTPALTIQEYIGNVASKHANISACLVTVSAPCEEPWQIAEFDEYVLVTAGLFVVAYADGQTTVAKQGQGVFLKKGMRLKISWPGPCQYVPICLPAFSPANCHREAEDGLMKDAAALERLSELHTKADSVPNISRGNDNPKARTDVQPVVFESKDVVSGPVLTITEYFGNVTSSDATISACLATVTAPCKEAFQTPEFDEYVLVISGSLTLLHGDGKETHVKRGEGILLQAGERVKWTWPGPCQYVPICLPAFDPLNCHREADEGAVKDAVTMKRLHDLHADAPLGGATPADTQAKRAK